jgi:hypothetical protein
MIMVFRVFDIGASRLMGVYDTEPEALMFVRDLIATNGIAYADELAVGSERADGSFGPTRSGRELLDRAETILATPVLAPEPAGETIATR